MTESSYAPIGFGGACARQLKLLWTSRRPLLLIVGVLGLLVLAGDPWTGDAKARLLTFWPLWLTLVGPVWAFAVFHGEGPSSRLYHWSLPVDRMQHTLARLAAGLVWLWIGIGVLIGVGALLAVMDGDISQFAVIDAAGWVNFFTGPLLGYLAVSLLTVSSDYPLRWFLGLVFLFPLVLSLLGEWLRLDELTDAILKPLVSEQWGLMPAIVGGLASGVEQVNNRLRAMADPSFTAQGTMSIDHWWLTTAVWVVLLIGIVALAASRHPDKLPRLRRSG